MEGGNRMINTVLKGFNRETASVTSVKDRYQQIIGWQFTGACGTKKVFLEQYYQDPHGMAIKAMEDHKHGN
jgi:hypothetical protein